MYVQKKKIPSNKTKKKKRLFGAQRIREIAKPLQFLELMKATFDWRKHKAAISGCEASRKKFTGRK